MRWDAEQRLGHFAHLFLIKVLQILRSQQHGGFLFANTLEAVSDVLNGCGVGEPDVQLIKCRHRIALSQQLVRQERQNIEQHGVANIFCRAQQSFHTENEETAGCDVGVSIEKLRVRALAHGVQPQQHLAQDLFGVELVGGHVIAFVLRLDQVIEVREDGIVLRPHPAEIGSLCDAPFSIQLREHDLNGVDMGIRKILVSAEEVLEEGNVLRQQGAFSEGFRGGRIVRVAAVIPAFRFQHIDDVFTGHKVGKAAADSFAHFLLLMLGIQRDNGFAGLQQIEDEELHQIGFALTGIAEDKDIGGGLVLVTLVEVHEDVAAILVFSNVEALCVRFAAVIEGIEICHRVGGEHTLKLRSEGIVSHRACAAEALLLAEQESVHIELAPYQFGQHIGLQQLQRVIVRGSQLDVDRAVEQRLLVAVAAALHGDHVLQVRFCNDGLPQVIGVRFVHAVFIRGVVEDTILLGRGELPGIDTQGDPVLLA